MPILSFFNNRIKQRIDFSGIWTKKVIVEGYSTYQEPIIEKTVLIFLQNFEFDFLISNLPRMTKLCIGVFEKKRTGPQALFWYYFNFSILDCDYRT